MAEVDLVDETFIAVPPARLVPIVADPAQWRRWWPDLDLEIFMNRGNEGIRWSMRGALVGSCEIWLEAVLDGTLVHYYLRGVPSAARTGEAEPFPDTPAGWRQAGKLRATRARAWKVAVWALKDACEGTRRAGEPPPAESAADQSAESDPVSANEESSKQTPTPGK